MMSLPGLLSLTRSRSTVLLALLVAASSLLSWTAKAEKAVVQDSTTYRIALAPKSTNSPYFDIARNGCMDAAARLGSTCLYIGPETGDAVEQAAILSALIDNREIDGLAISVIDALSIVPVIEKAVKNNISIVTFDSDSPESSRSAYIGTNNTFFGEQLGKVLKQLSPQGGTYAVVSAADPNVKERKEGLKSSLRGERWSEISLSPSHMAGNATLALEQMGEFAKYQPTAIVPLMGAPMRASTWKQFVLENPDITLVVADSMQNQLELLAENYAAGLVGQKPYEMGFIAVETLVGILEGKPAPSDFIGTNLLEHTNIPLVLPELVVNHNLIGDLHYVGLILFALVFATATGFASWVWYHRAVRVVRVAQPKFLIMVAVGVVFMASAMIPLGFDDSNGYNEVAICMTTPWLGIVGFTLTFSALFGKTWRVFRIFRAQTTEAKPTEAQVLRPFFVLFTANVLVLSLWTALDPLTHVRDDHEGTDGWNRIVSTYGSCKSENVVPFVIPLAFMNVGVLFIGNWLAYETRMIKSEFSESKFIALILASLLQCALSGIPLLFVVREQPQAFYLILTFMIFVISTVILVLIFLPKIAYALNIKGMEESEQNQLIQERIQSSVDAIASTRNPSSMLTAAMSEAYKIPEEQAEDFVDDSHEEYCFDDASSAEQAEEEVPPFSGMIDADCSFARASVNARSQRPSSLVAGCNRDLSNGCVSFLDVGAGVMTENEKEQQSNNQELSSATASRQNTPDCVRDTRGMISRSDSNNSMLKEIY